MADFDVAAAIVDFLADGSRSTLELPHMTTGQRKKTKMLVDKYPELQCASFGFGAERQLHLFKAEAGCAAQQAPLKTTLECQGAEEVCDSPDRSTNVSTDMSDASCSSPASPRSINHDRDTESAKHLSFANVRNTFIHFDERSVDERTVQSMPHGMFGKFMLAEASQKRDADTDRRVEDITPSNVALGDTRVAFSDGALVMVDGLVKTPMFNGLAAVVQGWDEASARYRILIGPVGGNGATQKAMVKEENLKLISPCP
jgi:hypothetical protein